MKCRERERDVCTPTECLSVLSLMNFLFRPLKHRQLFHWLGLTLRNFHRSALSDTQAHHTIIPNLFSEKCDRPRNQLISWCFELSQPLEGYFRSEYKLLSISQLLCTQIIAHQHNFTPDDSLRVQRTEDVLAAFITAKSFLISSKAGIRTGKRAWVVQPSLQLAAPDQALDHGRIGNHLNTAAPLYPPTGRVGGKRESLFRAVRFS